MIMRCTHFSKTSRMYTLSSGVVVSLLNGTALIWNEKTEYGIHAFCHNGERIYHDDYDTDGYAYQVITLADAVKRVREH